MPITVIAFIATAVQCALCDWTTGIRIKTATEFSSEQWAGVYDKHIAVLEKMKASNRKVFVAWMLLLYKDCWSTTRQYLAAAPTNESLIEEDEMGDYGDIEGINDEVQAMEDDEE
ncbi:hypothetical protein AURDEDRAFT_166221 [Auricularia subglabra TFB-10046 SS5]|nr:hypothetical protein AURDEDRAFT_166221 [Auricularia subglabra TFB-10046 SS5]